MEMRAYKIWHDSWSLYDGRFRRRDHFVVAIKTFHRYNEWWSRMETVKKYYSLWSRDTYLQIAIHSPFPYACIVCISPIFLRRSDSKRKFEWFAIYNYIRVKLSINDITRYAYITTLAWNNPFQFHEWNSQFHLSSVSLLSITFISLPTSRYTGFFLHCSLVLY